MVRDDLERSRLTVFFRLLLAIPHYVWIALWSLAAVLVAVILWIATLTQGRPPRELHAFVSSFVRYSTHVAAYLYLGASPYPGFTGNPGYPVDVEIDPPSRQNRWTVAFRLVLVLPAILLSTLLSSGASTGWGSASGATFFFGGGVLSVAALLGWFACLARGRMPNGLRDLVAYGVGYGAQVTGYLFLLTDRYPSSDPELVVPLPELPGHPVRLAIREGLGRSRLTVLFRLPLTLPHIVWLALWFVAVVPAAIAALVAALVAGRTPRPLHRFLAAYIRYSSHVFAFLMIVGGLFPGFTGAQGVYPIDFELDPPTRQRRVTVAFRLVLALPALVLAGALSTVVYAIGLLGWFAALATGRMPKGLRDLGATSIRYQAQTYAYLLLVTGRYPDASPVVEGRRADEQLVLELEPPLGAPA